MRIVIVGPAYPLRGGIAHSVTLLFQKLKNRGHEVHVLSFKRQYPSLFFPGKTQQDEGEELIPISSTPYLDSINPLTWLGAALWLKKKHPDLVLFMYWMPFFAPCFATIILFSKILFPIKTLYLLHNVLPHEKKLGDNFLSKLGLRFVDFFIAQSKAVLNDLLFFRPDANVKESPHPLYEMFPPSLPKMDSRKHLNIKEKNVILYFGYIRAYKGLIYLVEAMPKILNKIDVRLLVCGEFYEGKDETLSMIRDLGIENKVSVYDHYIPNEEVAFYFSSADLLVLPYVTATQSGIVQVAYHYEKPVVVTKVGGLPEVVLHNISGYVVDPQNAQSIAEAVLDFYQKKKEKSFVKGVCEVKKKYSGDRMAEVVESFIQDDRV